MKGVGLILCFIFIPASASFYDELHGAMHSVRQGFGKLLSDVVVDFTDTVHCTISAVEHVLTLNGLMKSKSQYGNRCKDGPIKIVNNDYDPLQKFLKERDTIEEQTYKETGRNLHTSIAKVNTTLTNALDNHESQRKIESISKVLKDETAQLTKVSNILRQELNTISNNVDTELQKFEHDLGPSIWTEIEKERNNKGNDKIFNTNQATQKLDTENIEIKHAANDQNSFNKVKREFEQRRDDVQESANNFPKNFRDVAHRIRNNNHNEDSNRHNKIATGSVFNVDNTNFDTFSPFYDPGTNNDDTRKKVIEDTASIISDSMHNEEIMNKLFKDAHVSSVFGSDNRMLNF